MPVTGAAARPPLVVDDESVLDWMQLHVREILITVLVIVAVVGGAFLYRAAAATQAAQAEQALVGPEESLDAGNLPLAQSDLKTVVKRYKNTAAAAQASMLLANSYYQQHKFADGVASLQQAPTKGAAKPFASAIERLIAEGYAQEGKSKDAAVHFMSAATMTPYPTEQARLHASAARAYAAAGDTAAAVEIWKQLANQSKTGEAPEAQLMLGELTIKPVK
jgi:predicted negative regulator of RcsB-dependent stress response